VLSYVAGRLADGDHVSEEVVLRELHCVGRAVQGDLWELREASQQMVMF
jgi:hypothetical protein